jgi:hypothetical protein
MWCPSNFDDIGHGLAGCQPFAGNKPETLLICQQLFCNSSLEAGSKNGYSNAVTNRACVSLCGGVDCGGG